MYLFRTPIRQPEGPRVTVDATEVERALLRFFRHHSGYPVAVLITDDVITESPQPTQDQMAAADVVFMGGRDNVVDDETAALLIDAGYVLVNLSTEPADSPYPSLTRYPSLSSYPAVA